MEAEPDQSRNQNRQMHICPQCDSGLVQPTCWEQAGWSTDDLHGRQSMWRVVLRCPDCEWYNSGVFTEEEIDIYDEILDKGTYRLANTLKEMTQANMGEEIDKFAKSLEDDQILPEDF